MNWRSLGSGLLLAMLVRPAFAEAPLSDARLQPAAAELRSIFAQAAQDGVPDELLSDKLREGLAKGVPPARIAQVLRSLEQALGRARREAGTLPGSPPPKELLKAIVDAHAAGVGSPELKPLLRPPARTRAVEVLTDLAQRGYPAPPSAQLVSQIAAHEPGALDRLVGEVERARADAGLTYVEAVDALARATGQGASLEHALSSLRHDHADDLHGPPRDSSGARGPGHGKGHGGH
jgi:hypothetical protein